MKKVIIILTIICLADFQFYGCSTIHDPTDKQALRTLAGGAAGALLTWNTGGAIVGAFIMDIVNLTALKYEDRQLENGEEAAKRYNNGYKVEKRKEGDKKAEQTKGDDKKVELFIERSSIAALNVRIGSTVEANVQYVLLAPVDTQEIKITETRILWTANKKMEVGKREILKVPGTYVSAIKFTMPEEISKGYCILFTTLSVGKQSKTTRSVMNII